jgi:hypothetical protein
MPQPMAFAMRHRWMFPGLAAVVAFVLMNLAKDNAPWPVHIGLAVVFLGCAGWTAVVHRADRGARS